MSGETTLTASAAAAACDAIVDLVDGGTGAAGSILWTTAGDVTIAETTLSAPAFGAATSAVPAVASMEGAPKTSAAASAGGTVTKAKWRDKDDAVVWTDSVGTAGTAIVLSSNVFSSGDKIELTSYTASGE